MDNLQNKKSLAILALVTLTLIFIVLIIFSIGNVDKREVTINTSPIAVDVKINNQNYGHKDSGSIYSFKVGDKLDITLSRDGFSEVKTTYTVLDSDPEGDSGDSNLLYFTLNPLTAKAAEILNEPKEAANQESIVNSSYQSLLDSIESKYPILSDLPHYGRYFTISQGLSLKNPEDQNSFALYVDIYDQYKDQGRADATEFIESSGYNPSDYEIIYRVEEYKARSD